VEFAKRRFCEGIDLAAQEIQIFSLWEGLKKHKNRIFLVQSAEM